MLTSSPNNQKPKVSICVVTYNQQEFIGDCVASLLNQTTDFNYEIIIADDCSTDATREIAAKFAEEHPEKVRISNNRENLGPFANLINVCSLANGDYIAHCDGDDMWLPGKLQRQVDILDANPDVSGVFTNATIGSTTINAVSDKRINIPNCLSKIFTSSPLVRSSLVERKFDVPLALGYYSIDKRVYDFELYWLMHKNNEMILLGQPYVIYNDHAGGISKDAKIYDYYRQAIERLRISGIDSNTYNAMLLDFRISKYFRDLNLASKPSAKELLAAGRRNFFELLKIAMPMQTLAFLKKLKYWFK